MKSLPVAISAGIETVINGVVSLEPDILNKVTPLVGTVVAIELTDFQLTVYLLFGTDNKIQVMSLYDNDVDVHIHSTSISLARMGMSKTPNNLVLSGDVKIDGDVEKAGQVKEFMSALHIDWEEQLSKISGDIVAHKAGNAVRQFSQWGLSALQSLSQDASEYVRFEKDYVPTQHDVAEFIKSVDRIRDDVDRIEARITRLIKKGVGNAVDSKGST
jgi:ubiquinone biosynthesis protein UbiJ